MPSRVPQYLVSGWLKNILKFRNVSFIKGKFLVRAGFKVGKGNHVCFWVDRD